MALRFTSELRTKWVPGKERELDLEVFKLSTRILRRGGDYAPWDTGALAGSGRINKKQMGNYEIIFGGGSVPYGAMRHKYNRKNPHTREYLKHGGDEESKLFVSQLRRTFK